VFLYALFEVKKLKFDYINPTNLNFILSTLTYAAPTFVFISMISYYKKSLSISDFVRKYIFSIIVFIPMIITLGDIQFTFWLSAVHLFSSMLSLYEQDTNKSQDEIEAIETKISFIERLKLAPAQIVILSFSGLIAVGTLLLSLPISAADGKSITFVDAFFTATSATCVTGLSTISLIDNFSTIGQIIVLIFIQVGGLGFMTLSSSMTILLGKSLGVKNQVLMQDLLDISSFEDLKNMILDIIKYTLVIEFFGAILLSTGFFFEGHEFGQALYYGFFHSISAFCNAGFALFNNSLEDFSFNPLMNIVISTLIVLGGLGFIVIKEIEQILFKKKKLRDISVHTKIVLFVNFILVFVVAGYIFVSEYLYAFSEYSLFEQIQVSFFQSITTRTAGFNSVSFSSLHPHSLYLFCLVMFIGASPGSTGGGIKTTTFAILFQSLRATIKGSDRVQFFNRTVSNTVVVRSTAIFIISLMIVSFFILVMMALEPEHTFMSVFFEVISAFSTVGLSLGITPYLSVAGKFGIIILMFIGRVGPLTIALALGKNLSKEGKIEYPEGRILIG
jgi:trk system potassium uptake protein TrkH